MRRCVRIVLVGSVLLTAACSTSNGPPAPGAPAPAAPAPAAPGPGVPPAGGNAPTEVAQPPRPDLKGTCEALGQVYDKNMAPLAEALTRMVADRGTASAASASTAGAAQQREAQQALKSFAAAVRGATQDSTDARLRADGKQAADRLQSRSTDAAFFGRIRTSEDVNTLLGPTLKEWLSPIAHHCS